MPVLVTKCFSFLLPICTESRGCASGAEVSDWMWSPQSLWLDQGNAQAVLTSSMLKEGFSLSILSILFADGGDR